MTASPTTGFGAIARALRQRDFGLYVAGNAVSLVGTWMQRIAVGWLAWELTGSGAWLGLVAFADLFPALLIGPVAGAVADRVERLAVVRVGQTLLTLQAACLAALTASGAITVWTLLALVLFGGVVIGFHQPARLALVPSLVARDSLSTAIALNAVVFNLARFVGPALAGVLMVTTGTAAVFAANAASTLLFLAALARIRGPRGERRAGGLLRSVAEGLRYAAHHPSIATVLALMLALSLGVRPFVELLPGFAGRVFGGGAETLALLASTVGLGAVVGGVWLAQRGDAPGLARIVFASVVLAAIAVLGFAASASLWTALPAAAVAGFALTTSGVGSQTLLQMAVDGAMRGRVLSLYGILLRGGPALGAVAMGAASELVGLRWPLAAGALALLAFAAWAWRRRAGAALGAAG